MFHNHQPVAVTYPMDPQAFIARIVSDATTRPHRVTLAALQNEALSLRNYLTVEQWKTVIEEVNTLWVPRNLGLNLVAHYIEHHLITSIENESEMDQDENPALVQ